MDAIKERGETAFPAAGDGVVIRFRNSDLKRLEAALESPSFFADIIEATMTGKASMKTLDKCLEHGIKKDGKPYKIPDEVLDDIPIHKVWDIIVDGLCISMRGMPFKEHMEKMAAAYEEAKSNPSPPMESPASISTNSVVDPSGPASE